MNLLLSNQERLNLVFLVFLITLAALFETVGIASIFPYISVLTSPDSDIAHRVFSFIKRFSNEELREKQAIIFGWIVMASLIVGTLLSGVSMWLSLRFSMMRIHTISQRILSSYLKRDYEFFIQRSSSTLLKNLLSEVDSMVGGVLTPLIQMTARILVAIFIIILLFTINFEVASITVGVFLLFYVCIYVLFRKRFSYMGSEAIAANEGRYKILTELFGGIREVKLCNKENYYLSLFSNTSQLYADMNSRSQLISLLPKYMLEIVAFGGMVLVTILMTMSGKEFSNFIPLLSLYAAAGYKLLPCMQQIFMNLTSIRYSAASLNLLSKECENWPPADRIESPEIKIHSDRHLKHSIRFDNVTYSYPDRDHSAVGPLNFVIDAFKTTGIVGASGAGKSTVLDLLLGLLVPDKGTILVDGIELDVGLRRGWAEVIGYVPQHTYLTSGTVAENIAFGNTTDDIDMSAVEQSARAAQIFDVIMSLPNQFNTSLGERGLRLSGGQRQRIAIARALYRSPEILIFDEATSALDSDTEDTLMEAIKSLSHQKTIVIVTHRKTTLGVCDRIYTMNKGLLKN